MKNCLFLFCALLFSAHEISAQAILPLRVNAVESSPQYNSTWGNAFIFPLAGGGFTVVSPGMIPASDSLTAPDIGFLFDRTDACGQLLSRTFIDSLNVGLVQA